MTLNDSDTRGVVVRRARREDLSAVVELIREHCAYERAAAPDDDLATRLLPLLFAGPSPRLTCFLAVDDDNVPIGYATCSAEISTWRAVEYLHMDCLFLRPEARGSGVGGQLVDAVERHARESNLTAVQWQTPDWNEGAIRFYDRLGASRLVKQRYTLQVTP